MLQTTTFSGLWFFVLTLSITWKSVYSGCPVGWSDVAGICYKQLINSSTTDFVSWGYANSQCKKADIRGRLPTFKNEMDWNVFISVIKQVASQPGLQSMNFISLGGYKLNDEWYWLDGSKMSDGANFWQTGEPNGFKDEKLNCVGFNSTPNSHDVGYRVTQCDMALGFICQMDSADTSKVLNNGKSQDAIMSENSESCPAGWDTVDGICYKEPAVIATEASPDDGAAICLKLNQNAKLPEFYNFRDYDNFIRYISKNPNADHKNISLGLRKKSVVYANSDSKSYYLNWYVDEPSGKECVFTSDIHGYMWITNDCDQYGYIFCQIDTRTVKDPLNFTIKTFNKYLSESESNDEAFGRAIASQLKIFNTSLKFEAMFEIQKVLHLKSRQV